MNIKTKTYLKIKDLMHIGVINSALSNTLEMTILSTIAVLTPIFLKHPQILIGIIINALLIKGAFSLKKYQTIPLIILPSVGVILGGYLFGGLTKFVFYMMPAIWIGNTLLVQIFRTRVNKNYLTTLLLSSLAKTTLLFGIALVMYTLNIIPKPLLMAMGYMQFITAMIGGIIVFTELNIEKWVKLKKKN